MSNQPFDSELVNDDRAVAPLIGTIILFGFLIILLSGYQAEIVPNQNQGVEYEHLQQVENDLIQLRSSILRSGQADVQEFATVKLGTSYPVRVLSINPPSPAGTLQTSEPYNITITNDTGATVNVSTRFLDYQPGYNELSSDPVRYENSVLYREGGDNIVVIEDQNFVRDGDTVAITAIQNNLDKQETGRVTIELYPTRNFTTDELPTGDLTVRHPTRLTGDQYWNQAFTSQGVDVDISLNAYEEGVHELEYSINTTKDSQDFKINTVGINQESKSQNPVKQAARESDSNSEKNSDDLPENAVGFDDKDDDGEYDDNEPTYSEDEFKSFTAEDVDLVIERDISSDEKVDIDTNSLLIQPGVSISTVDGNNIDFDVETDINISRATIDSGKDIFITSGKTVESDIFANDATFRFSGKAEASAIGGAIFVNNTGDNDRTNGGTYIENQQLEEEVLILKSGNRQGSAEFGEIDVQ